MLANTPTQPIVLPTIHTGQTAKSYQGKIATADWDFLERCCQGKTKAKAGQLNTYQLPRPPILLPLDWRALLFERCSLGAAFRTQGATKHYRAIWNNVEESREYPQQRWAAQDLHNRRKHRLSRRYGIPEFATCESGWAGAGAGWWAGAQQTEREETRTRHLHSFPSFLFFNWCEQFHHGLLARAPPRCETRFPIPHLSYLTPSSVKPTSSHLVLSLTTPISQLLSLTSNWRNSSDRIQMVN